MATKTYTGLTSVIAGNLDDTALVPMADKNGNTRKATIAQLRTAIFASLTSPVAIGPALTFVAGDALRLRANSTAAGTIDTARVELHQTAAAAGTKEAIVTGAYADHASGTVDAIHGITGQVFQTGAGTTTWMRMLSGGGSLTAGTVTNLAALAATAPGVAGATLTNLYGLHVGAMSVGSVNWAIYCDSSATSGGVTFRTTALATNATVGHVFLPSCAGAPTGVPANIPTGQIAMQFDSSNNFLYAYLGGAWKKTTVFA
jgi:hypothetical protein